MVALGGPVGKSLFVTAFDAPAGSGVTIVGQHQNFNGCRLQRHRRDDMMLLPIVRNCLLPVLALTLSACTASAPEPEDPPATQHDEIRSNGFVPEQVWPVLPLAGPRR